MDQTLQILEKVNQFYNGAFTNLILLTICLITLVGVIIPLVLNYFQNKSFKKVADITKKELYQTLSENIKKQQEDAQNEASSKMDMMIKEQTDNIYKSIDDALSGIYSTQGNYHLHEKKYADACLYYARSIIKSLSCGNEINTRSGLKDLKNCLDRLRAKDLLKHDIPLENTLEMLIDDLEKHNDAGGYYDDISGIKNSINTAKKKK